MKLRNKLSKSIIVLIIICSLLCLIGTGCSAGLHKGSEPVTGEEFLLDTICTVSVYEITGEGGEPMPAAETEDTAKAAIDDAFSLCSEMDDMLSRTKSGSDVGRINSAGGEWTEVNEETADLIRKGIEYSKESGGAFDITIGGVTELWDFHAVEGEGKLPDEVKLKEAVRHVDYKNVEVDGRRVRIKDPEARLDLGGIAKGYIGDRMTEVLEDEGVTSGIINLGGNVICIGGKTKQEDFVIGVEAPFSDRTDIIGKINARDKTLVTSGIYERKIEVDGKLYHHILDTVTGQPAKTDLDAVTLTAEKGRSGDIDALSTICLIKGSEEGLEFIEGCKGVEAVFVLSDGSTKSTSGIQMEPVS